MPVLPDEFACPVSLLWLHIPSTKPSITELVVRYVTDAAVSGWGVRP